MLQEQPDGSRQQDGGIRTAAAAHQHSEREIVNRFAAEQENRHDSEQRCNCSIDGTGQCRLDAVVNHIRHGFAAAVDLQVFADAVKYYDGTVDRITYNRQQRRYESGIDFQMQQGEPA